MVKKRAVSPMVSTVLLIMIVVILAIIILLWSRGFVKEVITKDVAGSEVTVQQLCSQLQLTPIINEGDNEFGFENKGNTPVYAFNVKIVQGGSSSIIKVETPVNPGFSTVLDSADFPYDGNTEEIIIIPILLGEKESGNAEEFECDNYELEIK